MGSIMATLKAAANLGVTCRQLRRLKNKYTSEGESGLINGNEGRKPKHALSEELRSGFFKQRSSRTEYREIAVAP